MLFGQGWENILLSEWTKQHYLLKIIQEFWLVKSGGWNHHIRSVVAQIYDIYDMTKFGRILKIIWHYDVIWSYIENT